MSDSLHNKSGRIFWPVFCHSAPGELQLQLSLTQTDATALVVLHGGEVDTIGRVGAFVPRVHLGGSHSLLVSIHLDDRKENVNDNSGGQLQLLFEKVSSDTHNVRVEWLHIDVADGAAGKRPHLGFVFESSSDLQKHKCQIRYALQPRISQLTFPTHLRVEKTVKQEDKEPLKQERM